MTHEDVSPNDAGTPKTALAHYRQITGFLHTSLQAVRQAASETDRFEERMGTQHWHHIRDDIMREALSEWLQFLEAHLPKTGTLEEQLLALPPIARAAYRARLRLDAAEEDFAVHLLTWADHEQAAQDEKQDRKGVVPKQPNTIGAASPKHAAKEHAR